jgi:hypothetical protein
VLEATDLDSISPEHASTINDQRHFILFFFELGNFPEPIKMVLVNNTSI